MLFRRSAPIRYWVNASACVLLALGVYFVFSAQISGAQSTVVISYALPEQLTLREPVSLQIAALNGAGEDATVDFGKNRAGNTQVLLTKPDGSRVSIDPRIPLQPDEAWVRGVVVLRSQQGYQTELLLSEWAQFDQVGAYWLDIEFIGDVTLGSDPVQVERRSRLGFEMMPRNQRVLRDVAERLVQQAQSPDASTAFRAAKKLMHLNDPVVVPYLSRVISERKGTWVDPTIIRALERIGNADARAALLRASESSDPITSEAAGAALTRLDRQAR